MYHRTGKMILPATTTRFQSISVRKIGLLPLHISTTLLSLVVDQIIAAFLHVQLCLQFMWVCANFWCRTPTFGKHSMTLINSTKKIEMYEHFFFVYPITWIGGVNRWVLTNNIYIQSSYIISQINGFYASKLVCICFSLLCLQFYNKVMIYPFLYIKKKWYAFWAHFRTTLGFISISVWCIPCIGREYLQDVKKQHILVWYNDEWQE